jgi:predicted RNA binding protein YcfA (HicA-like mRNA interferase family)
MSRMPQVTARDLIRFLTGATRPSQTAGFFG